MSFQLYNSLTKEIEEFVPALPGKVRFYACGPTVYNFAHLGNLRCYVFNDLLRRYLHFKGYDVDHVMNITDVDDKTIRDSQQQGQSLQQFTDHYLTEFLKDLESLNIEIPERMPRATEEIDSMVEMIEQLLEKGHAYKTEKGDIYFKIESFESYGKLVNLDLSTLRENAEGRLSTADEYEKESAQDFALWKAHDPEDGDVFWETRLGKGRPGWHIECSAMSTKFLGDSFDIHTGGVDLRFPHHTNEIAQSECATGKPFVRYWLHNEHLMVNGKKMSKSAGNFYTLRDLLAKGYDPVAIRYELLKTHYRQQLDFREDHLAGSKKIVDRFEEFASRLADRAASDPEGEGFDVSGLADRTMNEFTKALDSDLNISEALAAVFEFQKEINRNFEHLRSHEAAAALRTFREFDSVLGLFRGGEEAQVNEDLASEVEQLLAERREAREAKDFQKADQIRERLDQMGIEIKDTPEGTKWKLKG